MADRFWVRLAISGTGNWSDTANWSATSGGAGGASVPGSGDVANFNLNGLASCRLNISIDVGGITSTTAYIGTIDAATDNLNHTLGTSGLEAANTSLRLNMGSGTWTCAGNFDARNSANLNSVTSTLVLTGASKVLGNGVTYNNVTVNALATYTLISATSTNLKNTLSLAGTLTANGSLTFTVNNGLVSVDVGGSLAGSGSVVCSAGVSINVTNNGTISVSTFTPRVVSAGTWTIQGSGTFASATTTLLINNSQTLIVGSDLTFTGDLVLWHTGGVNTFDLSGNHSITLEGDLSKLDGGGSLTWQKGTGTITLTGTANQSIDFNGEAVEDIDIDKAAGTVTLTGAVTTDSLALTDGTLDIAAINPVVTGNYTQAAGTDVTGTGLIAVSGNFAINGTAGNTCTFNGPDLDVTGTAEAHHTTATNSDASAGTEIDATDACTDGGGNVNWNFAAAAVASGHYYYRHLLAGAA